jgi:hypothetical protein
VSKANDFSKNPAEKEKILEINKCEKEGFLLHFFNITPIVAIKLLSFIIIVTTKMVVILLHRFL